MRIPPIPYKIAALGQFKADLDPKEFIGPIRADLYTVDQAVAKMRPQMEIGVDRSRLPSGFLNLQFEALGDFKPDQLIRNQPYLKELDDARRKIADGMAAGRSSESIAGEVREICPDLPVELKIERQSRPARHEADSLESIFSMVAVPQNNTTAKGRADSGPLKWCAEINTLLRGLMEEVFHDPLFRTCEAAWRGVEVLLKQGNIKDGNGVVLELVPVTEQSLEATLERLSANFTSHRPDLILIDLPFDNTLVKIGQLEKVAEFAQNLLVPAVAWVAPGVLGVESWAEMAKLPYIPNHLEDIRFAKLSKVRQRDAGQWLALACNRFLSRYPYGEAFKPRTVFFDEEQPLWISPVWALAALAAQSISACGWPTVFTRHEDMRLQDLPVGDYSGSGYCATEFLPSADRILQLIEAGFMPLAAVKNRDTAFIPKEITFTGGSLRFQLLLSRVLGFLFWCRENLDLVADPGATAGQIQDAIVQFWRQTGYEPPDDLDVSVVEQEEREPLVLSVKMTPPASILRGGFRVEFSFVW
jgi:predicted component of type VI protein secretion system